MGSCPEIRQLLHRYGENTFRGEVVLRVDSFLTGVEKTHFHLWGSCPESRQLPHGYKENTFRGEVDLRVDNFLTGIEKTLFVGKLS